MAVLHSIGVTIESYDIVAARRIGAKINGKNRKVIIRFLIRKNASYLSIKNGKKLKYSKNEDYKNYFINANLGPEFRQIFNKLYKLKKIGKSAVSGHIMVACILSLPLVKMNMLFRLIILTILNIILRNLITDSQLVKLQLNNLLSFL